MSDIIGKTLDELQKLDPPDLGDASWQEVDYVCGVGMGGVQKNIYWRDIQYPGYHTSGEHAMRLFEALHNEVGIFVDAYGEVVEVLTMSRDHTSTETFAFDKDPKKAITLAYAKCVVEGLVGGENE